MLKIFEVLQDLFLTFFGKDPQEVERRRRLRAIYEELRQASPNYFRRSPRLVLPDFAAAILELTKLLRALRELFDKTICAADPKLAERYRDYLIIARLPAHLQDVYGTFTFSSLRRRVINATDPQSELGRVQQELKEFLGNLADPEFYTFDAEYTATQRLVSLARHSFTGLLTLFDPDYDAARGTSAARFRAAGADEVLPELQDLYYVLAGLDLSDGVERNLDNLLDRLSRESAAGAKRRMRQVISRLRGLAGRALSPETLLNLMRSIKQDPLFAPEVVSEQFYYLEDFRSRFLEYFQRMQEKIQWELHESSIQDDLRRLFRGADLLPIEGYDPELQERLQARDFEAFSQVKPLRILKSFLVAHFDRTLREPVKRLIVEGKFDNRIFQNMFTNTYFGCEGLAQKIAQFEEGLKDAGPLSVAKLQHFLQLYEQGKPVHNIVGKICDAIEGAMGKLVQEGANLFYNLSVLLLEVLNDARLKAPEHVTNLKFLGGSGNSDYLARLAAAHDDLHLFVTIIKNFVRVQQVQYPQS
jgi:hypothetical protein